MEDPLRPKCCSRVLCGCLHFLDGRDSGDICSLLQPYFKVKDQDDTYKCLRKKYPGYLSACVAFLSKCRSDEEKEELRGALERGRCAGFPCADSETRDLLGRLHVFEPTHRFSLADLDHAVIRHLASVLSVACAGGSPAVARSMLRHNRGGNTLWPDDPSQLLPHGTEESLRGITQRSEETQHTEFQDALLLWGGIISICGATISTPPWQFLPDLPLHAAHLIIQQIMERQISVGPPVDHGVERRWASTFLVFVEFCASLEDLTRWKPAWVEQIARTTFPIKQESPDAKHFAAMLLASDMIVKNLPLFMVGTTVLRDVHIDYLHRKFARFGAIFYGLRSPREALSCHPDILHDCTLLTTSHERPGVKTWRCFADLAEVQYCCAPDCSETCATLQQPFRRCGGCGVPKYCSRECQRRAWKHAPSPHRDFCSPMCVLMEKTGLTRGRIMDLDDCLPFVQVCEADGELANMARECTPHMVQMLKKPGEFLAFQPSESVESESP